jgi:Flp pilus assembly protein TadD
VYANLGAALHSMGRHVAAIDALRQAAQLAPGDAAILVSWGHSLRATLQHRAAQSLYLRALQVSYTHSPTSALTRPLS